MPYPSVNLEVSPEAPKPAPSPIIGYRAFRHAYTHDEVKCVKTGVVCDTFADAVHADGSVTGWVPISEAAFKAATLDEPKPAAPPEPAPVIHVDEHTI